MAKKTSVKKAAPAARVAPAAAKSAATAGKSASAAKKISAKSSVVPEGQTAWELFKPRNEKKAATAKKAGGAKKLASEMIAKEDSAASKKLMAPRVQATQDRLYGEVAIEEAELERFPNRTHVRRYTISFTCPEFTCLCPRSGFPDFATIQIQYVPDQYCVELKSLKLYINGFRNKKVFHEDVTNVIIQDMIDLLDPWEIEVVGDFTVRGNIHTVITAYHDKEA